MMTKKVLFSLIIAVFSLCIIGPFGFKALSASMKYCHEGSAWGALNQSIYFEMNDYYDAHGKYPKSLDELNLVFSDGATREMLNQIQYQTDGTSCQYSYYRQADKWNRDKKARVEITISESGKHTSTTATQ